MSSYVSRCSSIVYSYLIFIVFMSLEFYIFYQFWKVLIHYLKHWLFNPISPFGYIIYLLIYTINTYWLCTIFQQYSRHWEYSKQSTQNQCLSILHILSFMFLDLLCFSSLSAIFFYFLSFMSQSIKAHFKYILSIVSPVYWIFHLQDFLKTSFWFFLQMIWLF